MSLGTQDVIPLPQPLLSVQNISVAYEGARKGFWAKPTTVKALDGVSFDVFPGETLGLVGESGSGKSTTGRAILRRIGVTSGRILFKGQDITTVTGEPLRKLRRHMQIVFQDPYASLNPRMRVLDIIAEPMMVHGLIRKSEEARDEIAEMLRIVGLPRDAVDRYPHAFSGG
ncbi:MAG: ATP-binding cassette domain-containing protein, partial [Rhizobiales bacterium]|nr:ATP-binding cassette domain-containing protein [Hyphomicrobiales bacterium]